jgi:hypothetical protein
MREWLPISKSLGLNTKMLGGGFAGLQAAAIKMQLGDAADGIVNVDLWEPVPTMQFPGIMDFIKIYQAKAPAEGVDLLGYFLPPFAYSELQILGDAIAATKSLDNDELAEYMHSHPFNTIEQTPAKGEIICDLADGLVADPRHDTAVSLSTASTAARLACPSACVRGSLRAIAQTSPASLQ